MYYYYYGVKPWVRVMGKNHTVSSSLLKLSILFQSVGGRAVSIGLITYAAILLDVSVAPPPQNPHSLLGSRILRILPQRHLFMEDIWGNVIRSTKQTYLIYSGTQLGEKFQYGQRWNWIQRSRNVVS
jgi:hypothetical protein